MRLEDKDKGPLESFYEKEEAHISSSHECYFCL